MFKKFWLLLLPLLFLTGCATEVRSNKDATYVNKLDRVLFSNSLDSPIFAGRFDGAKVTMSLTDRLTKRGVTVQTIMINRDILGEEKGNDLQEAISTYKPSQILELVPVSVKSSNGPYEYNLEGSIYDAATMKTVWRSQMQFSNYSPVRIFHLDADKLVDALIQKLDADGLLPPLITQ